MAAFRRLRLSRVQTRQSEALRGRTRAVMRGLGRRATDLGPLRAPNAEGPPGGRADPACPRNVRRSQHRRTNPHCNESAPQFGHPSTSDSPGVAKNAPAYDRVGADRSTIIDGSSAARTMRSGPRAPTVGTFSTSAQPAHTRSRHHRPLSPRGRRPGRRASLLLRSSSRVPSSSWCSTGQSSGSCFLAFRTLLPCRAPLLTGYRWVLTASALAFAGAICSLAADLLTSTDAGGSLSSAS